MCQNKSHGPTQKGRILLFFMEEFKIGGKW